MWILLPEQYSDSSTSGQSAGARVAVIDVDVHHGNGTQTLFYDDPNVLTVSVHGDPANLYPFYAAIQMNADLMQAKGLTPICQFRS
jgi:acetoin utilization deacetylase AcuC-like enzyme